MRHLMVRVCGYCSQGGRLHRGSSIKGVRNYLEARETGAGKEMERTDRRIRQMNIHLVVQIRLQVKRSLNQNQHRKVKKHPKKNRANIQEKNKVKAVTAIQMRVRRVRTIPKILQEKNQKNLLVWLQSDLV